MASIKLSQSVVFENLIAQGYDKAVLEDATIFVKTDDKGRPILKMFYGNATKPKENFFFRTVEQREKYIAEKVEIRKARKESKIKYKEEQNKARELAVGDILVSSWGYEQTNVDFYQVIALAGKASVSIRPINASSVGGGWDMTDYVEPVKDSFKGEAFTKKVTFGTMIKINSFMTASKWNGMKCFTSSYA